MSKNIKEKIIDLICRSLDGEYWYCDRVWSAWQDGTMSQDDFYPANEAEDMIEELADAIVNEIKLQEGEIRNERDKLLEENNLRHAITAKPTIRDDHESVIGLTGITGGK